MKNETTTTTTTHTHTTSFCTPIQFISSITELPGPRIMNSRRLFNVYEAYTGGTPTITSAKFLKMMKDATLLDHDFQQSDADIIFTKSKEKGQRTVTYDGFKRAIEMVSAKKQVASKDLAEFIIMKCGEGPR